MPKLAANKEVGLALKVEMELQQCYRRMFHGSDNPKIRAVIHDLLVMEEMNEVLLRSLSQSIG